MAVYTRRLGAIALAPPSVWVELYRATSEATVIIRDLVLTNASTTTVAECALRIRPLTKAGTVWLFYAKLLPVGTTRLELRQELVAGEALEAFSTTTGLNVLVTGYVFD